MTMRLPKEFRLEADEIEILCQHDDVVLRALQHSATVIFDAIASLPDDFMVDGRDDTPPQPREAL